MSHCIKLHFIGERKEKYVLKYKKNAWKIIIWNIKTLINHSHLSLNLVRSPTSIIIISFSFFSYLFISVAIFFLIYEVMSMHTLHTSTNNHAFIKPAYFKMMMIFVVFLFFCFESACSIQTSAL